jgi:hypothetical protein
LAAVLSIGLLCAAGGEAAAQQREATPDPIPGRIEYGDVGARLTLITRPLPYRASAEQVRINYLNHAGDGSGRLFVADMHCCIRRLVGERIWDPPFLDIKTVRGESFVYGPEGGLTSFAFHPDYARRGRPGYGRFYTVHTETADSVRQSAAVPVFRSPVGVVDHVDVLTEWRVSARDPDHADPGSRREILRIEQPHSDQNMGLIAFRPGTRPGEAEHGLLYIAMGGGGRYGYTGDPRIVDPHDLAQDPGNPYGAILRIDPLPQSARVEGADGDRDQDRAQDRRPYRVPADNPAPVPLWGLYAPEVYAYGFRNPQRFAWDPANPAIMLLGDIGEHNIEEVNRILPGRNYGWSRREGTFVIDRMNGNRLYRRPADSREPPYEYPVAQYDHDEGHAIVGGFVYRGRRIPALRGLYIFGDIANGRIFYVPVAGIQRGRQAVIKELRLINEGAQKRLTDVTGNPRAGLRFGQDEAGEIYLLARVGNYIFRLDP